MLEGEVYIGEGSSCWRRKKGLCWCGRGSCWRVEFIISPDFGSSGCISGYVNSNQF